MTTAATDDLRKIVEALGDASDGVISFPQLREALAIAVRLAERPFAHSPAGACEPSAKAIAAAIAAYDKELDFNPEPGFRAALRAAYRVDFSTTEEREGVRG